MTADDLPTPLHYTDTPNTVDQLGALCRAQQKMIASLRDDLTRTINANRTLSGELLEASEARAAALVSLAQIVQKGKALTHTVVHQRDTILKALRYLTEVSREVIEENCWNDSPGEFQKAVRQSLELLTVIDQLQAKQAKVDAGLPHMPGAHDGDGLPPVPGG